MNTKIIQKESNEGGGNGTGKKWNEHIITIAKPLKHSQTAALGHTINLLLIQGKNFMSPTFEQNDDYF